MASAEIDIDEEDGIFKSVDDSFDDVDASAAVFTVIERASIPDKFFLRAGMPFREKSQSYALLSKSFGQSLSSVIEKSGQLGLVTLRGLPLTATCAPSVCKQLLTSSGVDHRIAPLRWSVRHLLVAFDTAETYENWGNLLLDGRLNAGPDHQVAAIEPAIFCSVPRALVNVTSQEGHELHASLAEPIMPFSAAFTHMRITIDSSAPAAPPGDATTPQLCLVLMFDGRNQALALRTLEKLGSSPWRPVELRPEVGRALGPGVSLYRNGLGGPLLGVHTGCPRSGVRVMVLVKGAESLASMSQFYQELLAVEAVVSRQGKAPGGCAYVLLPLSSRCELMVAHLPGLSVSTSPRLQLLVKVKDLTKVNTPELVGGSFRLTDPDGNSVVASATEADM